MKVNIVLAAIIAVLLIIVSALLFQKDEYSTSYIREYNGVYVVFTEHYFSTLQEAEQFIGGQNENQ